MKLIFGKIDIQSLVAAHKEMNECLLCSKINTGYPEKFRQAAAIQCFEFSYELSWKTMKRILYEKGVVVNSPKNIFREAAKEKLIDNPDIWFKFQDYRNLTVHTYDAKVIQEIFSILPEFLHHMTLFVVCLENDFC